MPEIRRTEMWLPKFHMVSGICRYIANHGPESWSGYLENEQNMPQFAKGLRLILGNNPLCFEPDGFPTLQMSDVLHLIIPAEEEEYEDSPVLFHEPTKTLVVRIGNHVVSPELLGNIKYIAEEQRNPEWLRSSVELSDKIVTTLINVISVFRDQITVPRHERNTSFQRDPEQVLASILALSQGVNDPKLSEIVSYGTELVDELLDKFGFDNFDEIYKYLQSCVDACERKLEERVSDDVLSALRILELQGMTNSQNYQSASALVADGRSVAQRLETLPCILTDGLQPRRYLKIPFNFQNPTGTGFIPRLFMQKPQRVSKQNPLMPKKCVGCPILNQCDPFKENYNNRREEYLTSEAEQHLQKTLSGVVAWVERNGIRLLIV